MNNANVWRVLDVNANRAAEGLRTLDDIARVVREDAVAAEWLKELRHALSVNVARFDRPNRLSARCTESDAGTELTSNSEAQRGDWSAIVTAACERVGQSLRGLEEFSKLINPQVASEFKTLRYRAYDVLAQIELRLRRDSRLKDSCIYLLVNCSLPLDDFLTALKQFAEAGVDLFQLRDKDADGAKLVAYARAAVACLKSTDSRIIINDRIDVALISGAAGVHLGQEDICLKDARRVAGPDLWIGVSTHNLQQAEEAQACGADYIGCGPTFPSRTKSFEHFPGIAFLKDVAQHIRIPAFAIGGIDAENLDQVCASGVRRVALSSAVHQSHEPLQLIGDMKRTLQSR